MKIFVAGAAGVIGRLLLPKLIEAGHQVVGMTHREEHVDIIRKSGARAFLADAFDREAIMSAIAAERPEAVIHQLTSLRDWNLEENARIRIEGTRNLVDAAKAANVSRIVAQSIGWAYEPGESPAAEDVPLDIAAPMPRKRTIEGITALERAAAELPNHVILRYGMLYGPGTWYDRQGMMADKVRRKEVPATNGVTSFLHVEDAAHAALLALDWASGPVNIVDDEPAPGTEWLPVYASAAGAPEPGFQAGSNRGERGASNFKARNEYGWEPSYPTWRTGFGKTMA